MPPHSWTQLVETSKSTGNEADRARCRKDGPLFASQTVAKLMALLSSHLDDTCAERSMHAPPVRYPMYVPAIRCAYASLSAIFSSRFQTRWKCASYTRRCRYGRSIGPRAFMRELCVPRYHHATLTPCPNSIPAPARRINVLHPTRTRRRTQHPNQLP